MIVFESTELKERLSFREPHANESLANMLEKAEVKNLIVNTYVLSGYFCKLKERLRPLESIERLFFFSVPCFICSFQFPYFLSISPIFSSFPPQIQKNIFRVYDISNSCLIQVTWRNEI